MLYGFTFNGKHSSFFNCYVKTNTRTLKAEEKIEKEDIQLRNGSYTFKTGFNNRNISLDLTLLNCNYTQRKEKLRDIANWLYVEKPEMLIFDDEPTIYYLAMPNNVIDTNISGADTDNFTLEFDCDPFKYKVFTPDYIYLGSMLALGSVVPLGVAGTKTFDIQNQTLNFALNSTAQIERYVIELEGVMDKLQINNMILDNINGRYKIDLYNKLVYKINLDGTVEQKIQDFNMDWDTIPYKTNNYQVVIATTGLISQNKITFFFTDTYL